MLKKDYGEEAFKSMFVNRKTGRVLGHQICKSADRETDVSYLRFRRKLQMVIRNENMGLGQFTGSHAPNYGNLGRNDPNQIN